MVKPIGQDERDAWDSYVAAAAAGWWSTEKLMPDDSEVANGVAAFADAMLIERRKRISPG